MVPSKWFRTKHIKKPNETTRSSRWADVISEPGGITALHGAAVCCTVKHSYTARLRDYICLSGRPSCLVWFWFWYTAMENARPGNSGTTSSRVLTSELPQRTGLPAQPLEKGAHHLGTAEALEACTHVPVIPPQRADLEHPA